MADLDLTALRAKAEAATPIAWMGWFPGAGSVSSHHELTRHRSTMENWGSCTEITPLYDMPYVIALLDRVEKAEAALVAIGDASFALASANDEIANLRALLVRAGEALDYYGDVSKYPAPLTGGMGDLWSDCGTVARSVLLEIKEAIGHE